MPPPGGSFPAAAFPRGEMIKQMRSAECETTSHSAPGHSNLTPSPLGDPDVHLFPGDSIS